MNIYYTHIPFVSVDNIWICRCGLNGEFESLFIEHNIIGFYQPDYNNYRQCDDLKSMSRQIKSSEVEPSKYKSVLTRSFAIANRITIGDYIMVPSKIDHSIFHIGIIKGNCIYNPKSELTFSRKAEWIGKLRRLDIDKESLHSMGSLTTIFKVKYKNDLMGLIHQIDSQRK